MINEMDLFDWMDETFGEEPEWADVCDKVQHLNWWADGTNKLPPCPMWSENGCIYVLDEEVCDFMTDWIEVHCKMNGEKLDGYGISTMYYDPLDDLRSGEIDKYTGWYSIDII